MKKQEQFPSPDLVQAVVDSEKEQQRIYRESQLDKIIPDTTLGSHKLSIPKIKLVQAGETKWLDITDSELEAISNVLLGYWREVKPPKPKMGDTFLRGGLMWKVTEPGNTKSLCECITQERAGIQSFIPNHDIK